MIEPNPEESAPEVDTAPAPVLPPVNPFEDHTEVLFCGVSEGPCEACD